MRLRSVRSLLRSVASVPKMTVMMPVASRIAVGLRTTAAPQFQQFQAYALSVAS